MPVALELRSLKMPDRGGRRRSYRRRQRCREYEARGIGTHRVDERGAAGDIAADATERLSKRAFDYIDTVHDALALGNASSACAVHADRVYFVHIGHRAIPVGQITD